LSSFGGGRIEGRGKKKKKNRFPILRGGEKVKGKEKKEGERHLYRRRDYNERRGRGN